MVVVDEMIIQNLNELGNHFRSLDLEIRFPLDCVIMSQSVFSKQFNNQKQKNDEDGNRKRDETENQNETAFEEDRKRHEHNGQNISRYTDDVKLVVPDDMNKANHNIGEVVVVHVGFLLHA